MRCMFLWKVFSSLSWSPLAGFPRVPTTSKTTCLFSGAMFSLITGLPICRVMSGNPKCSPGYVDFQLLERDVVRRAIYRVMARSAKQTSFSPLATARRKACQLPESGGQSRYLPQAQWTTPFHRSGLSLSGFAGMCALPHDRKTPE